MLNQVTEFRYLGCVIQEVLKCEGIPVKMERNKWSHVQPQVSTHAKDQDLPPALKPVLAYRVQTVVLRE